MIDEIKIKEIWYMIEKECCRNSLVDLLDYWDLTIKDWCDFEKLVMEHCNDKTNQ